jgi:amino acid transporter
LGQATTKSIYCYLGYYNVCHLGAEIKKPKQNIPWSMLLSVLGIAALYLLLQIIVLGNLDNHTAANSEFVFSDLMQKWFGVNVAKWFTLLVLWVALSSLFAVMLGYSRVLYAAAADGNFIKTFAKIDAKKNTPQSALLWLALIGGAFSLLFKLKHVISAIVVVRICTQFLSQSVGLIWLQKNGTRKSFPFKMFLFPLPVLFSILIWSFVFFSSDNKYMLGAALMIVSGLFVFFIKEKLTAK